MSALNVRALKYRAMIGTGGIGSGMFFKLTGEHTLGREESRMGRLVDRRDYCKLHIISHYVQTLLGPGFASVPIGLVGDDDTGRRLRAEMAATGMRMDYVKALPGEQTMFCICFIYPDESGGNLTVDDSACSQVTPAVIDRAGPAFAEFRKQGLALAVPEVPLPARKRLLELATDHGLFRAASFVSDEIHAAQELGMFGFVDLIALNRDEAAALGKIDSAAPADDVAAAAVARLREANPAMLVSITAGKEGSWAWDGTVMHHTPVFKVKVASTAGAGDAHFSGIIAGLSAGLDMAAAQQLGSLTAALSVTSPHTINKDIDRESLAAFAEQVGAGLYPEVKALLDK